MPPTAAISEQIAKHDDLDAVDVDARPPRRLGVAADGVDVAPEARAPQDVGPEHEQHADEHRDVRQPAILVGDVDDERQRDEQPDDAQRDDQQRVVVQARCRALAQAPQLDRGVGADRQQQRGSTTRPRRRSRWRSR